MSDLPPRPPNTEPGTAVYVASLPRCNFCTQTAHYDFKTRMGPWANACTIHWRMFRYFGSLGIGKGQHLVVRPKAEPETETD